MKTIIHGLIGLLMSFAASAQIPAHWAQYTVEDTVNLPIETSWEQCFQLKLEEIGSAGVYKDLPKITHAQPVNGDFTQVGHSRRVHFDNGKTLLETIILYQKPTEFAYELSEIELTLKLFARRARGHFRYEPLAGGRTRVVWTYGFDQRNFVAKGLINRYIRSTHRFWMRDTLSAIKRLSEEKQRLPL